MTARQLPQSISVSGLDNETTHLHGKSTLKSVKFFPLPDYVHDFQLLIRSSKKCFILPSEIQNANYVVGKTSSNFITFLVPADFEYASIASISFDNLAFFQGPNEHTLVKRATGQVLTIWAKSNRVNRFPANPIKMLL